MRTTINLDPDVYTFATAYAGGKGITLSAAISELVRRAENTPDSPSPSSRLKMNKHGYLVITGPGQTLTPEIVKQLSEDPIA